jgi:hypothetical protein
MEPTKRELRQQKREIKRAGGKRRRRQLKQGLAENPDEARDTTYDFGRYRSSSFNGIDRDATRRNSARPPALPTDDEPHGRS